MRDESRTPRFLCIFTVAALTTSCTAIGVVSDFNEVRNTTVGCFDNLQKNPKYALLYKKLAMAGGRFPTDEELADKERPSPEAIQAAMDWWEEDQVCNRSALESYTNMDREFGAKVAGWISEGTDIFNETMAKTPPYGYINTRIKNLRERQKKDVQDFINAEVKRRQAQMQPATSDFLSSVLLLSLQALTRQQTAIFYTQNAYTKRVPSYRPVDLMKTTCSFQGKKFVCRNDSLKDGIRVEDIAKGIQQIAQQVRPMTLQVPRTVNGTNVVLYAHQSLDLDRIPSEGVNVAVVDTQSVLNRSRAGADALTGLKEYVRTKQDILRSVESNLRLQEQNLNAMPDNSERAAFEERFHDEVTKYKQMAQEFNDDLAVKQRQLIQT